MRLGTSCRLAALAQADHQPAQGRNHPLRGLEVSREDFVKDCVSSSATVRDCPCRCDKCQSTDILLVADPKTGLAYKFLNNYGSVCPRCGLNFSFPVFQSITLLTLDSSPFLIQPT